MTQSRRRGDRTVSDSSDNGSYFSMIIFLIWMK